MKIIVDKHIPYIKGIVEHYGEVEYLSGNQFTKNAVKDADTLIVRTVVHLGKDLLEGSKIKLICSATIGFDHIDTSYCQQSGIAWRNAPGCNSGSVMQYIVSALIVLSQKMNFDLKGKTIGIIGVGNVGTKVAKACHLLGMRVLLNDPPRQTEERLDGFVDLERIKKEADIISFHTPLIKDGEFKTYHMADTRFFESLERIPVIINSARGGIIETGAIKKAITDNKISGTIIDCWENEPNIDVEYMQMVDIATPHIAGYSADGKANASRMSLENLAGFWHLPKGIINEIHIPQVENPTIDLKGVENQLYYSVLQTYNPLEDSEKLTADPALFSGLRGNYSLRREYEAYRILNACEEDLLLLKRLGFMFDESL